MRKAEITRTTKETDIRLLLALDGGGRADIRTGCGFFDHMLELFARHGGFDLTVSCKGDTQVDYHHTVEDTGIVLGAAFKQALGDMRGITRYGHMILPMDEALILTAADISGRPYLGYNCEIPARKIGEMDSELVEEFLLALTRSMGLTLHVSKLAGRNSHHIAEGVFKALGRTLRQAVTIDGRFAGEIPSTKGIL